jgi:hypothetical protein
LCEDCQLELKWIPLVSHAIRENIYAYLQRYFLKNKKLQIHDSNVTGGGMTAPSSLATYSKTYNESLGGDTTLASISDEDLVQHAKQSRQKDTEDTDGDENLVSEDDDTTMEDNNVIRDEDELEEWVPHLVELGEDELEKIAAKEEREARYRRREYASASGRVTRQSSRFA